MSGFEGKYGVAHLHNRIIAVADSLPFLFHQQSSPSEPRPSDAQSDSRPRLAAAARAGGLAGGLAGG